MNILLYGNGSSGNHGCEAIVRGTTDLINNEDVIYTIHSASKKEDCFYGLDKLAKIEEAKSESIKRDFIFLMAYLKLKLFGNYTAIDGLYYQNAIRASENKYDIALSVGGDNYCYGGTEIYDYLNKAYQKVGIKTVLWGCSIEPDVVKKESVSKDFQRYHLIVARESITYEAVKRINKNSILAPDPAFSMKPKCCELDFRFDDGNVIGINVSPMIVSNEAKEGVTYENYKNLMKYILDNTNSKIALIPHVVWETNDDRTVLKKLYEEFDCNERLILVEDHSALELKYIISKCKLFVGARTHATIAAYSSCVPTLVVGYSVKARGIARDLFGTEENYVLPVQSLDKTDDLVKAFQWIYDRTEKIEKHLKTIMPDYIKKGQKAVEALLKLKG